MSFRLSAAALALTTVIFVPVVAAAQSTTVVVKGGLNSSRFTTDELSDIENLLGLTGGISVSREVNQKFGLQFEALYSQKGTKGQESGFNVKLRGNYIDFPVLARFGGTGGGGNFHVFTGPTVSLRLNAKLTVDNTEFSRDLRDESKSYDFGWTLGVGAGVNRFIVDARYTHGLVNVDDGDDGTIKNRTFSTMIGLRLR